ncbi:MAG: hypothetical protein R3B07_14565 [Polyangiaceae bacterium]
MAMIAGGGVGDDTARAVAVDSQNNFYVAGAFTGTINLGGTALASAGGSDGFIAKYSVDGTHLWSKRFGSTVTDIALDLAVDAQDNVVMTGYYEGSVDFGGGPLASAGQQDVFVVKFDGSGNHLWSKNFGDAGASQEGFGVAVDSASNVLVTGYYRGTIDFGGGNLPTAGNWSAFVAKLAPADGAHVWSKGFTGGTATDESYSRTVAVNKTDGSVLIGGHFVGNVDFGSGQVAADGRDAFAVKLASNGDFLWQNIATGNDYQMGRKVTFDNSGNALMLGYFNNSTNFGCGNITPSAGYDTFLVRLSNTGSCQAQRRYGNTGDQLGDALAVDDAGNTLLGGEYEGVTNLGGGDLIAVSGRDIYIGKLTSTQSHVWSNAYGAGGTQRAYDMIADHTGRVIAVGSFEQTVNFGSGPMTASEGQDIWIARFYP